MARLNGVPVMAALYTVMNEFEQIRSQFLVPNKSLNLCAGAYEGLNASLKLHGHVDTITNSSDNASSQSTLRVCRLAF